MFVSKDRPTARMIRLDMTRIELTIDFKMKRAYESTVVDETGKVFVIVLESKTTRIEIKLCSKVTKSDKHT